MSLQPVSQILLRHTAHIKGKVLLCNPPMDDLLARLGSIQAQIEVFTNYYDIYQHFNDYNSSQLEINVGFGTEPEGDSCHPLIILFLPKSKALLQWLLPCLATRLLPGGSLWLLGGNKAGIKSAARQLGEIFQHSRQLDAARHCQLHQASGAFTAAAPSLERTGMPFCFQYLEQQHELISYPGVFSHGRVDPGSAMLLEQLQSQPVEGEILDFGCGSGLIGYAAALNPDNQVLLSDINAMALAAAGKNTARLANTRIQAACGYPPAAGPYNAILSNPPFHQGIRQTTRVSEDLIRSAPDHLKSGGELRIVANRHLPYARLFKSIFRRYDIPVKNSRYQVLRGWI